jgi:hypothetical protein
MKPGISIVVFVLLCAWLALHTPKPLSFIYDPDMGVQTSGAQQIAAGDYPFIQWRTTYGPSRFYASYLARWISHERLGAEIVLCQLAYVLAYWLLFQCARMLTDSLWGAALITAAACLLLPRLHKYFIMLGPMWTLYWSLLYLRRPSWGKLIGIAAGITVTVLYRMDYGFWTLLAGGMAVMLGEIPSLNVTTQWKRRALRVGVALPTVVFLLAGPWLIFLLIHGAMRTFLYDSTIGGVNLANGLSLPYPSYHHELSIVNPANLLAMSFPGQYLVFLLSIAFIAWRWPNLDAVSIPSKAHDPALGSSLNPNQPQNLSHLQKKQLPIILLLAISGLLQSTYRRDYLHLLQSICVCHLLAGFIVVESVRLCRAGKFWLLVPIAIVSAVYVITISAGVTYGAYPWVDTDGLQAWSWFYSKSPQAGMRAALQRYPSDPMVEMINRVRAVVPAKERIFCAPYLTSTYFLSGHLSASGQLYIAPGYFNDAAGQTAMIDTLRQQGLPPIIEKTGEEFDNRADRSARAIAPKVFEFIEANYIVDTNAHLPPEFALWSERKKYSRGDS